MVIYNKNGFPIKPPLGIMPHSFWLIFLEVPTTPTPIEVQFRIQELKAAIQRYMRSVYVVREEWREEIFYLESLKR